MHAHAWDFADQPLVYQAFFGNQRAQDGVQVKWIAPTDLFIELGAEAGNGDAFPARAQAAGGLNGTTLFAHVGGDVGDNGELARRRVLDRPACGGSRLVTTSTHWGSRSSMRSPAKSRTWVADARLQVVARRQLRASLPEGPGRVHAPRARPAISRSIPAMRRLADSYRSTQSGWYLQGVYQFLPRWRAGLRYDALDSGTPAIGLCRSGTLTAADFPSLLPGDPSRTIADGRLEPERVLALAPAIRLGRGARRRRERPAAHPAIPVRHRRARRPQSTGNLTS